MFSRVSPRINKPHFLKLKNTPSSFNETTLLLTSKVISIKQLHIFKCPQPFQKPNLFNLKSSNAKHSFSFFLQSHNPSMTKFFVSVEKPILWSDSTRSFRSLSRVFSDQKSNQQESSSSSSSSEKTSSSSSSDKDNEEFSSKFAISNPSEYQGSVVFRYIASFFTGTFLIVLSSWILYTYYMGWQSENWIPTEAVIESAFLTEWSARRLSVADFDYVFHVNGKEYHGHRVIIGQPFVGNEPLPFNSNYLEFLPGGKITIYYDPFNPTYSTVVKGVQRETELFMAVIIGSIIVYRVGRVIFLRNLRKKLDKGPSPK